ncbi:hypothetical protein M413DRAFT_444324, partial [Hebeloma cylindrosporum]
MLPAEILDAIIDELGCSQDSDPESLKGLLHCALVCRSFHHRASGHLFANIVIAPTPTWTNAYIIYNRFILERLEGLYQILRKNDSIGPRVISFSLETALHGSDPDNIIKYGHTLPTILRLLSSIRRFSWKNHLSNVFCEDLGSDLMGALGSLGERTSLQSVSMKCFELTAFPLRFLSKMDHLSFCHMFLPEEWASTLADRQNDCPTRLRDLVLQGCSKLTSWIAQTPDLFSQLTKFDVWMRNEGEVHAAWLVMQATSETLEVLNLSDVSHFRYPTLIPGPVDLGILRRLRIIALSFNLATADRVLFPLCICGLLQPPTSPSQLENIEIQINWIDCIQGSEEARFVDEPGWDAFDKILSQESLHPKLRSVSLKLKMGYGWRQHPSSNHPPPEIVVIRDVVVSLASRLFRRTVAARSWRPKMDIEIYKSRFIL